MSLEKRPAGMSFAAVATLLIIAAAFVPYRFLPLRGAYDLPKSTEIGKGGDVVYATGERLYISTIEHEISPAPDSIALTSGGLYFLANGVLYLWDREGSRKVADTGERWLQTTADGRYLGFIDRRQGSLNLARQRIAQTVVFDTTTGKEVVRDEAGNGDRWEGEDLSLLYSESPPTFLGFDHQYAYASTASGDNYGWDLVTGERTNLGDEGFPETPNRPGGAFYNFDMVKGVPVRGEPEMGGSYSGRLSPDGTRVVYTSSGIPTIFSVARAAAASEPVEFPFDKTQMVLVGWLDDEEFLGMGVTGSASGEVRNDMVQMMTCAVASLTCRNVGEPVTATEESLPVTPFGDPRY